MGKGDGGSRGNTSSQTWVTDEWQCHSVTRGGRGAHFCKCLSFKWHWREAIQVEMSWNNWTISILNLRVGMAIHIENVSMYVYWIQSLVYWIIQERLRKWEEAWEQNLGNRQYLKVERKNRTRKDRDIKEAMSENQERAVLWKPMEKGERPCNTRILDHDWMGKK